MYIFLSMAAIRFYNTLIFWIMSVKRHDSIHDFKVPYRSFVSLLRRGYALNIGPEMVSNTTKNYECRLLFYTVCPKMYGSQLLHIIFLNVCARFETNGDLRSSLSRALC
jgi:hypothetical protein